MDKDLAERITKNETNITVLENFIKEMRSDIKEIKDKLLKRPSWFVSLVITTLVGIIISLIKFG